MYSSWRGLLDSISRVIWQSRRYSPCQFHNRTSMSGALPQGLISYRYIFLTESLISYVGIRDASSGCVQTIHSSAQPEKLEGAISTVPAND